MPNLPYHECPRFNLCSANVCPLDPYFEEKEKLKNEQKCKLRKATRIKIGSNYLNLLKYQGLTKREWMGKQMKDKYNSLFSGITQNLKADKTENCPKKGIVESSVNPILVGVGV